MSQEEIARVFGKGRTTITEYIQNIFKEDELIKKDVSLNVGNFDNSLGNRKTLYNLNMIISIGYRVNSREATQFRIVFADVLFIWYVLWRRKVMSGK